jgi:hypothetical protein
MQDEDAKASVDDLVIYFLNVFEKGKPLDRDELDHWRFLNRIKVARIKDAVETALNYGWITSTDQGLFITDDGLRKADER